MAGEEIQFLNPNMILKNSLADRLKAFYNRPRTLYEQKKAPLNNILGPLYESKKFSGRPSESILRANTRAAAAKTVSQPQIFYCLSARKLDCNIILLTASNQNKVSDSAKSETYSKLSLVILITISDESCILEHHLHNKSCSLSRLPRILALLASASICGICESYRHVPCAASCSSFLVSG